MPSRSIADAGVVLDAVPLPVMIINRDYDVVYANPAAGVAALPSSAAIAPPKCHALSHGFDHPCEGMHPCPLKEVLQSGRPLVLRHVHRDGAGEPVPVEIHAVPLRSPDGSLRHVVETLVDLSRSERAESSLREALHDLERREQRQRAMLDVARAVLQNQDSFEDTARAIFSVIRDLTGAEAGYVALLGNEGTTTDVLFLETGSRACTLGAQGEIPVRGLRQLARDQRQVVFDNDFANGPYQRLIPQGHIRIDSALFAPILDDRRVFGMVGLANKRGGFDELDVELVRPLGEVIALALHGATSRMLLRQSEARFKALFESSLNLVFVLDAAGNFIDANTQVERTLGREREAILGSRFLDLLAEPYREQAAERLLDLGGEAAELGLLEFPIAGPEGEVWLEAMLVRLNSGTLHRAVMGVAHDVSARKQAEQLRERFVEAVLQAQDEDRRQTARELHDEVGSALTSLMIGVQALAQRSTEPEVQRQARELSLQLDTTLANVSRLARGLHPLALEQYGLAAALRAHVDEYARAHGIEVTLHLGAVVDHLRGPATIALYRVVQEALTNVARHAHARAVSVVIEAAGSHLTLVIEDDGVGWSEREGATGTRGLGLPGIRERAALLGGEVRLEPTPGGGTTLHLRAPLERVSHG